MPMLVRMPRNPQILDRLGPYRSALDLLDSTQTPAQSRLGAGGLAGYEPPVPAAVLALVEVTERPVAFFDVGAQIGLYSALVAAAFPADLVRVVAFQPSSNAAQRCEQVAEANRLAFEIERLALGSGSGAVTQRSTTLDEYSLRRSFWPGVVSIDASASPAEVLAGGRQTFALARPALVIDLGGADDTAALAAQLRILDELGYAFRSCGRSGPGPRRSGTQALAAVPDDGPAWTATAGGLDDRFEDAMQRWAAALADCTPDTTRYLAGSQSLPTGWDEPYRPVGSVDAS